MTGNWHTIDFRPAPPGWRVASLSNDTGKVTYYALPGWLVQADEDGDHRVVAGEVDWDGEVARQLIGLWNVSAWYVLGPGDPDPSPDEVKEELERRANEHHRRNQP
ncbi:MAG TPA: hypothetical protein VIQ30_19580 [Pseudonocardia sp.]